ncbi:tyrosine-type recombinase/integrase [Desulfobacula toluolica]|uniref:Putative tyrosine recombinase n=1 Tax=Desulfobacula toluolica (strain DSM 7467 / Tol2) TaxID=651182 RepID=K0NCH9_DESTT
MLEIKIEHFLDYCKVSNFATRSIQSLRVRLNEFNRFIKKTSVDSVKGISYRHLKVFITQCHNPSIHTQKARIWSLRQFFHFLKLNGWVKTNTASDFPYPKIEKTIPHFLTIEEYNRILSFFYRRASDAIGFRNLVMIMMLGLLGLRLSSVLSLNGDDIDKHLHAHLFRHTAATHLNKVSDPEITRHVLGHVRSSSTRKYTHLNPDQYATYMQIHPYMEVTP